MATAPTTDEMLADLRARLQSLTPGEFEKVAAALISELLDVRIAVAKSGFQHGGDAGPAGRRGRRFRIETKRYADSTSLSDRELLGEVDDALAGFSQSYLSQIENGRVNLTLLRLHDLAQAFGVHPRDLLSELNEHED